MRISDWSSDVCSSDLGFEIDDALGLRPFRQRGEVAAVGVERVRGHAALDFEVDEVVVGAGGSHGMPTLRRHCALIPASLHASGTSLLRQPASSPWALWKRSGPRLGRGAGRPGHARSPRYVCENMTATLRTRPTP